MYEPTPRLETSQAETPPSPAINELGEKFPVAESILVKMQNIRQHLLDMKSPVDDEDLLRSYSAADYELRSLVAEAITAIGARL